MRVDVYLAPSELTPAALDGRVVAVIDVLRATTTIAAALFAGARTVIPFVETEDAVRTAKLYERGEVTLAGERHMVAIPGFDLGNSPLEFTERAVGRQTVLLTTTNGTRALLAAEDAKVVYVASYANYSITLAQLQSALDAGHPVAIVCASREGLPALDDSACAGRFVQDLRRANASLVINDGAQMCELLAAKYGDDLMRLFEDADHGRALRTAGFVGDLEACATIDRYPVLAVYEQRAILNRTPAFVPAVPGA
ncbi:MAG TPA: 2-phosphosulfolactate phosphatase [Gemmatimonadaceae bacterium]|nr:2-phosphosulfolactate phosphatase [Gemmatimonadaceae bacterium]